MNISRFKLIAILAVMGVFIGIGFSNAEAQDYFPLEVGNRWVYTPSYCGPDTVRTDTIVGTETVNGTLTYIWKREEAVCDAYHERRWLAKDNFDLKVYKIWSNEEPLDSSALVTPPWTMARLNPDVGDTWIFEGDFDGLHLKAT